ncbi:MAG: DUF2625 family protein [Anaerolineaceae bacterium]|nr:DUF2625 family protein [Anaerolineaceae bacterium]
MKDQSALAEIQSWIRASANKVQAIPRIDMNEKCEEILGISENSSLGTLINHTGGLSVSNGIIRHFGGSNQYGLSVKEINDLSDFQPSKIIGILIIADDFWGGLFGININRPFGSTGSILYLPPDTYNWEDLAIGHTAFLQWSMNGDTTLFYRKYSSIKIPSEIPFHRTLSFSPPLWSVKILKTKFEISQIDSRKAHAIRFSMLKQLP